MHTKRAARMCAVQFLYQCDLSQAVQFCEHRFEECCRQLHTPSSVARAARPLVASVLHQQTALDEVLVALLQNWSWSRVAPTERAVLRLAAAEYFDPGLAPPPKVVLAEANQLAAHFGSTDSPRFVNGVLDRMIRQYPERQLPQTMAAAKAT